MKLKLLFSVFLLFIFSALVSAQVGINTIEPKGLLDVVVKNPAAPKATDGIIIPRMSILPKGTNLPTAEQTGMLVYLTAADGANQAGFYFFNGTAFVNVTDAAAGAFVNNDAVGNPASTATANIRRSGKVSIGSSASTGILNVEVPSTAPLADRTAVQVTNNNRSAANQPTVVMNLENTSETTGEKIGLKSRIDALGSGIHTGIALETEVTDGVGVTTNYGLRSTVGSTSNATSTSYGLYSKIGTAGARGTNYAVYAYSQHADVGSGSTDALGSYSGYFRGDNFAIRSEDDLDGYRMPTISGATGQVLTTNGTDTATWSDLPAANSPVFFEKGTPNAAINTVQGIQRSGSLEINMNTDTDQAVLRLTNTNTNVNGNSFSVNASNDAVGNGSKVGLKSVVSAAGSGEHIGIESNVQIGSDDTTNYGIKNNMGVTRGANSINYGIYNETGNVGGNGTVYALYSVAENNGTEPAYSGYFRGDRFAIKTEDDMDGYELPTVDGTSGQVLTTDGAGVASWQPVGGTKSLVRGHLSGSVNVGMSDNAVLSGTDYRLISYTEDYDIDGNFDPSTNVFTAPRTGYYKINAVYHSLAEDSRGAYGIAIIIDGSTFKSISEYHHTGDLGGGQSKVKRSVDDIVFLNANQTVSIYGRYDDLSNFLLGQSAFTYFTVEEL